jgi:hypothetical protein
MQREQVPVSCERGSCGRSSTISNPVWHILSLRFDVFAFGLHVFSALAAAAAVPARPAESGRRFPFPAESGIGDSLPDSRRNPRFPAKKSKPKSPAAQPELQVHGVRTACNRSAVFPRFDSRPAGAARRPFKFAAGQMPRRYGSARPHKQVELYLLHSNPWPPLAGNANADDRESYSGYWRFTTTMRDPTWKKRTPQCNVIACRELQQADSRGAQCTPNLPAAWRAVIVHTLQCGIDDGAKSSSL